MPNVIEIPEELAHELDRLAGAEHKPRAAYAVDVLWRDVRRNKQRDALKLSAGAWNPVDHPELDKGGAAWVEQIRSEPDGRFDDANQQRLDALRRIGQAVDQAGLYERVLAPGQE